MEIEEPALFTSFTAPELTALIKAARYTINTSVHHDEETKAILSRLIERLTV